MKKKMSILLILLISFFSFSALSFGAEETTTLYQLKLLSGDGTGFNLQGQLKRRDAAAFIVKYLGKNEFVKSRADIYNSTGFSDVDANDWYAPYVGYLASKDIVNGYGDGTFKPDESVSEKAFIKMALVGLGYEYESDFNWDNLYKKAFEVGLVENINYAVKTEDSYYYTRGDVVSVIYNALDQPIKGENRTVVQRLIDENVVSPSVVEGLNLVKKDSIETQIEKIEVNSQSEIVVTFNEDITSYDLEIRDASDEVLQILDQELSGDALTITTEDQTKDEAYTVTFSDVVDEEYFVVESLTEDFNSFEAPIVESNYFRISKVEVLNNKEMEIFFTHPVDESAELGLLYILKKDGIVFVSGNSRSIKINSKTGDQNSVKLWLVDEKFNAGETYTLDINGDLQSTYTVYLNKGLGEEITFTGTGQEPLELRLEDFEVLGEDNIRLIFNKALDEVTALDKGNYALENLDSSSGDYSQASSVKFSGTGEDARSQIDVTFVNMSKEDEYLLTIEDIKDYYGTEVIEDFGRAFIYEYDTDEDKEVKDVRLLDADVVNERIIELYFDSILDPKSEGAVISIRNEDIMEKRLDTERPYVLKLILSSRFEDDETEDIEILDGLYDENGNRIDDYFILNDVRGSSKSVSDIKLDSASFISETKVKVVFDRSVDIDRSDDRYDYTLAYEGKYGESRRLRAEIIDFVSDTLAILTFETLEDIDDYDLTIEDIYDLTGHRTDEVTKSLKR